MVARDNGTVENHLIVNRSANPNDRIMLEAPALNRGRLNRMQEG
jgi:hypothetical protein